MKELIFRTEDIRSEEILSLFVATTKDQNLVNLLASSSPLIIEGSRGTGKSFLLRVCEQEQLKSFESDRVLPIYISFQKSSLLYAKDPLQFQKWMLTRLCSRILRVLYERGFLAVIPHAANLLAGGPLTDANNETKLERIAREFEESYRAPGSAVPDGGIPEIEDLRDAVEDICRKNSIRRLNLMFDEAAHIFRPEQQRQFFTLFRDLRSPYLTCNAAVYPGVTSFGSTFEVTHDARIESLQRDVFSPTYSEEMKEIILKQADSDLQRDIERNGENFDALAYSVSGNPRLLLKTVSLAPRLGSQDVLKVIREFYRNDIWAEHTALSERYAGHRFLIDWGRTFVEQHVIPNAISKNEQWKQEGKSERTCIFWVHRDVPAAVNESIRLLSYTGIVTKLDSGVIATRRELGTRYSINIGCLAASSSLSPIAFVTDLRRGLSLKRFTEYGANLKIFADLSKNIGNTVESDLSNIIERQLAKSIEVLDLTDYQKSAMKNINILTIRDALGASEEVFQRASYIGPKRSRQIKNTVVAAVLEYLSG